MRLIRMVGNKNFLQILFALLLIALIMFISNYIVFRKSISEISDRVNENNRLVVNHIIQSFEDTIKEMNSIIYSIHTTQNDPNYFEDDQVDMAQVYRIQRNISSISTSAEYLEEVIVFYPGSNLAITSTGTIHMQQLFNNKYRHRLYGAEFWKSFSSTSHALTVFPDEEYEVVSDSFRAEKKNLMVVMGSNKVKLSKKNIMLIVDTEKLLRHVNQKVMMQGTSLIVLDQNRDVILSTEKNWNLLDALNDMYFQAGKEKTVKQKDYEYHFYQSDYSGFIYIDKTPYRFADLDAVTRANQYIMLITILSVLLLSIFLSLLLYRPVTGILKLVGDERNQGADFGKIYNKILQMQEENRSIRTQMSFINAEIRRGVFLHALDEFSHSRAFEKQLQIYFNDFFHERQFVMVSFILKPMLEIEQVKLHIEDATEHIQFGLQSISKEATVFHVVDLQYIALFGIGPTLGRDRVMKEVQAFMTRSQAKELKGFTWIGAISRTHISKISNCYIAYRELMHCYQYRNIGSPSSLIDYYGLRYSTHLYLPMDEVVKAMNCLIVGNRKDATHIIHHIIDENVKRNIHQQQLIHVALSIFYYMIIKVSASGDKQKELTELETHFVRSISSTFDVEKVRALLLQVLDFVEERVVSDETSKLTPALITQYIATHYMENLYLDHMAETFDTSPKYFSSYFKKTFDINFIEYLNKIRISHAKELLRSTELTIAEIGEQTGYMNATTFASTFRKYQGISPSEYRKQPMD